MKEYISFDDFKKIDIRVGTILEAEENNFLNKPSIILKIADIHPIYFDIFILFLFFNLN